MYQTVSSISSKYLVGARRQILKYRAIELPKLAICMVKIHNQYYTLKHKIIKLVKHKNVFPYQNFQRNVISYGPLNSEGNIRV